MKATQVLLLFFIIFVTLLGCSRRDTPPPSPPAAVGSQEELSSEAKKELHQVKKYLERGHTIIIGDEDITEQREALTRIVNSIPPGKDKAVCLSCLHQGMGAYVMQHVLQPIFPPAEYLIQNNPNSYCKHIVDKAWTRVTFEYDFLIGSSSEDKPLASLDIEERKERTVQAKAVFQIGGSQPSIAVCVNSECSDELPLYLIEPLLSNPLGWSMDDIKGLIKQAAADADAAAAAHAIAANAVAAAVAAAAADADAAAAAHALVANAVAAAAAAADAAAAAHAIVANAAADAAAHAIAANAVAAVVAQTMVEAAVARTMADKTADAVDYAIAVAAVAHVIAAEKKAL